jgi:ribosome-associated protein
MDIKRLQALVVDALEDVKAQEIAVFDTMHLTALFDRLAIASGTSNRQTKALAASVRDKVKSAGGQVISVEGEDTGEWVLVDLGDMIVHIMQPAIRAYYRLEEIWGDKPIKLADAKRGVRGSKASPSTSDSEVKPRRGHIKALSEEGESAKPARARKTATAEEGAAPKRASKSAASKSAPSRSAPSRSAPGRSAPARSEVSKSAASKSPASKTAGAAAKAPAKTASKTAAKSPSRAPVKSAAKSSAKSAKTPVGKTVKVAATKIARPARKTTASR